MSISTIGQEAETPLTLNRDRWENTRKGIDYTEVREKKSSDVRIQPPSPKWDISWAKILIYVLIGAILIYLIYLIITRVLESSSPRKRPRLRVQSLKEAEDNLDRADLDDLLSRLVAERKYREALRVHYLQILQELNEGGFIIWKKFKTNGDYLFETKGQSFHDSFLGTTLEFERAWYGEKPVSEKVYLILEPGLSELHQILKRYG